MSNFSKLLKEANAKRSINSIPAHPPVINFPKKLVMLEEYVQEQLDQQDAHINALTDLCNDLAEKVEKLTKDAKSSQPRSSEKKVSSTKKLEDVETVKTSPKVEKKEDTPDS